MTKWELAQMMGATIEFDTNPRTYFDATVFFGNTTKSFKYEYDENPYEIAAEFVFEMIRKAVKHADNVWSHP